MAGRTAMISAPTIYGEHLDAGVTAMDERWNKGLAELARAHIYRDLVSEAASSIVSEVRRYVSNKDCGVGDCVVVVTASTGISDGGRSVRGDLVGRRSLVDGEQVSREAVIQATLDLALGALR